MVSNPETQVNRRLYTSRDMANSEMVGERIGGTNDLGSSVLEAPHCQIQNSRRSESNIKRLRGDYPQISSRT